MNRLAALDRTLLLFMVGIESAILTRFMRSLTRLGDTESWVVIGLAFGLDGGIGLRRMILLGLGATLATAISQPLKRLTRRSRPSAAVPGFHARIHAPDDFSFPSGHTAVAFAVACALAGQGHILAPLCFVLALGIGISRVYLGAHYPLDVLAGAVLGVGSGFLARLIVNSVPLLNLLTESAHQYYR